MTADRQLSETQRRILATAATRPRGTLCPTPGLYGNAQAAVLRVLLERGYCEGEQRPVITEKGRSALETP